LGICLISDTIDLVRTAIFSMMGLSAAGFSSFLLPPPPMNIIARVYVLSFGTVTSTVCSHSGRSTLAGSSQVWETRW